MWLDFNRISKVQYDKNESRLIKITKINEDLAAAPPFSILYFDIQTSSPSLPPILALMNVNDPITQIDSDIKKIVCLVMLLAIRGVRMFRYC
jgi:hypothetical protein